MALGFGSLLFSLNLVVISSASLFLDSLRDNNPKRKCVSVLLESNNKYGRKELIVAIVDRGRKRDGDTEVIYWSEDMECLTGAGYKRVVTPVGIFFFFFFFSWGGR